MARKRRAKESDDDSDHDEHAEEEESDNNALEQEQEVEVVRRASRRLQQQQQQTSSSGSRRTARMSARGTRLSTRLASGKTLSSDDDEENENNSDDDDDDEVRFEYPLDLCSDDEGVFYVRNSWRFYEACFFCNAFADILQLAKYSLDDLEEDFVHEEPALTIDIYLKLLNFAVKRSANVLTWEDFVRKKVLHDDAVFPIDVSYKQLSIQQKVVVFQRICEWTFDVAEDYFYDRCNSRSLSRLLSIGQDKEGRAYWLAYNQTRLYREKVIKSSSVLALDRHWRLVCRTVPEWTSFLDELEKSTDNIDQHLFSLLEPIKNKALSVLEARERDQLKEVVMDLADRRTSSRLATKMPFQERPPVQQKRDGDLNFLRQKHESMRREAEIRLQREMEERERKQVLLERNKIIDDAERELLADVAEFKKTKKQYLMQRQEERAQRRRQRLESRRALQKQIRQNSKELKEASPDHRSALTSNIDKCNRELKSLDEVEAKSDVEYDSDNLSVDMMQAFRILGDEIIMTLVDREHASGGTAVSLLQIIQGGSNTDDKAKRGSVRTASKWRKVVNLVDIEWLQDLSAIKIKDNMVLKYTLYSFLNPLRHMTESDPFMEPVDPIALNIPDYFEVVQRPMDLGTILKKFFADEYETLHELVDDMQTMCQNCYLYNGENADISQQCQKLEREFIKGLVEKVDPIFPDKLLNEECLHEDYMLVRKLRERERRRLEKAAERERQKREEAERRAQRESERQKRLQENRERRAALAKARAEAAVAPITSTNASSTSKTNAATTTTATTTMTSAVAAAPIAAMPNGRVLHASQMMPPMLPMQPNNSNIPRSASAETFSRSTSASQFHPNPTNTTASFPHSNMNSVPMFAQAPINNNIIMNQGLIMQQQQQQQRPQQHHSQLPPHKLEIPTSAMLTSGPMTAPIYLPSNQRPGNASFPVFSAPPTHPQSFPMVPNNAMMMMMNNAMLSRSNSGLSQNGAMMNQSNAMLPLPPPPFSQPSAMMQQNKDARQQPFFQGYPSSSSSVPTSMMPMPGMMAMPNMMPAMPNAPTMVAMQNAGVPPNNAMNMGMTGMNAMMDPSQMSIQQQQQQRPPQQQQQPPVQNFRGF